MTKDEAIKECKDNVEKYGTIFGDFHVISLSGSYECVAQKYLHAHNHTGKIYHTEKAVNPEDDSSQNEMMRDFLLANCKTRKEKRKVKSAFKEGSIKQLFKKVFR